MKKCVNMLIRRFGKKATPYCWIYSKVCRRFKGQACQIYEQFLNREADKEDALLLDKRSHDILVGVLR